MKKHWSERLLRASSVALLIGGLVAGCAEELEPRDDAQVTVEGAGPVVHEAAGAGWISRVDASAEDAWVHLDLDDRSSSSDSGLRGDAAWELAFQRFKIASNGGISGPGVVRVAPLAGADFAALTEAPSTGWVTDAEDGDDPDVDLDLAFLAPERWYSYNPATHALSPAEVVYVIQSSEGHFFKLRILSYYSDVGTAGQLSLEWALVSAPPGGVTDDPDAEEVPLGEGLVVDASAAGEWVYVDAAGGVIVAEEAPEASVGWDLAFSRTQVRTNGGTSGPGLGGVLAREEAWEAVLEAPTVGYQADVLVPLPGPPGSGEASGNPVLSGWYDYDVTTHAVSSRGQVYLVRTAGGGYVKAQITGYSDGRLSVKLAPVEVAPQIHQVTLRPAAEGAWTHLSLRTGEEIEDGEGLGWDLAALRTQVRTNSGPSGPGAGGAAELGDVALDATGSLDAEAIAEDVMLPLPGPPGSGEFAGSEALNSWYDYDATTHAVTPRATTFVVRTADGGFARVRVDSYADGALTLSWIYAGAGRDAL